MMKIKMNLIPLGFATLGNTKKMNPYMIGICKEDDEQ